MNGHFDERSRRRDRVTAGDRWQADPNDRSVLIFLSHNMLDLSQMAHGIGLGAWSASSCSIETPR